MPDDENQRVPPGGASLPDLVLGGSKGVSQQRILEELARKHPECVSQRYLANVAKVCASRGGRNVGKAVESRIPGVRKALRRKRHVDVADAVPVLLRSKGPGDDRLYAVAWLPYESPGSGAKARKWTDARLALQRAGAVIQNAAIQPDPTSARKALADAPAQLARALAALRAERLPANPGATGAPPSCVEAKALPLLLADECDAELFRHAVLHLHGCAECLLEAGARLDESRAGALPRNGPALGGAALGVVLIGALAWAFVPRGSAPQEREADAVALAREAGGAYRAGDWDRAVGALERLRSAAPEGEDGVDGVESFTYGHWLATIRLARNEPAAAVDAARWARRAGEASAARTGRKSLESAIVGTLLLEARSERALGTVESRARAEALEVAAGARCGAIAERVPALHARKRMAQHRLWVEFQGDLAPERIRKAAEDLLRAGRDLAESGARDRVALADASNSAARAHLMAWQLWGEAADLERARALVRENADVAVPKEEPLLRGWIRETEGLLAVADVIGGKAERAGDAVEHLRAALTVFRTEAGRASGLSSTLRMLAVALCSASEAKEAEKVFEEALAHARGSRDETALVEAARHGCFCCPGMEAPLHLLDPPDDAPLSPAAAILVRRWLAIQAGADGASGVVGIHVADFARLPLL